MKRGGCIYIMTNKGRTTLYIGVTSDLKKRIYEHKHHLMKESFTDKYNLEHIVYYEGFDRIEDAIAREKQLKAGKRKKKEELITAFNPGWSDLYYEIMDW